MNTHKIWIITLFPEYFKPLGSTGVAGSAIRGERGVSFEVNTVELRNYSPKNFKGVDGAPYGGGPGMVMRADVLENAIKQGVMEKAGYEGEVKEHLHIVYTGPRGKVWRDEYCREFARNHWADEASKDLVFICGRYEGIDERFLEQYVDETISIGDFVLTGGELAVLTIIDSAIRFVPGVLGNKVSAQEESFSNDLLEHPQYTRPSDFNGQSVPKVLTSGHHENIKKFQKEKSIELTKKCRPDLFSKYKRGKSE